MTDSPLDIDAEFEAIQTVFAALKPLDEEAQQRVLDYVSNRLGLALQARRATTPNRDDAVEQSEEIASDEEVAPAAARSMTKFGSFAELCDAAQPKSQSDKALVAAYWLQQCQGADSFDSFSINKELKNLGEGVANITSALDTLKGQKPALVLQLKKSGKSRQARKTYKVTVAGLKSVENMLRG
jgi:hypothetical protein